MRDNVGFIETAVLLEKAPEIVSFFTSLFGSGSQYTQGVQWLTAYYQYYVLGDGNSTTRLKAQDQNTPQAQAWFAEVTGVPIYDRYRFHALKGTDPANGADLHKSFDQRINDYLALGPDTSGQSRAKVAKAVELAEKFQWGTAPGSWKQLGTSANTVTNTTTQTPTTTPTGVPNQPPANPPAEKTDWVKIVGIGAAVVFVGYLVLGNRGGRARR